MARALYHALPAGLDALCEALHLTIRKDVTARPLMLQMARPRSLEPLTWWHETDPAKLFALMAYCDRDVDAERLVDVVLPELPPTERRVFQIDGRINQRGLRVDVPVIERMAALAVDSVKRLDADMRLLTGGKVKSCAQVGMLQTWLEFDQRSPVPDLRKHTVAEAIAATPRAPPKAREALLVRQEAARASPRKLTAMLAGRSLWDDRLRGLFQYGGAGRTLRWAGRRVQPHNFPRGTIGANAVRAALEMILAGATPEDLIALFDDSCLGVLASCLRSCFVAGPGRVLAVADLAQIEARIVCWLAGQFDVLNVFASGEDTYTYTARQQGSDNRQFGKVLILACGFGMGGERFQATAATYGIILTLDQAVDAVRAWRDRNESICQFWWDVGDAASRIASPGCPDGAIVDVRGIRFSRSRRAMRITLPSGRDMIYHHIGLEASPEHSRPQIVFAGVDPKTKQWSKQRTYGGKLVENITQALARDVLADVLIRLDDDDEPLVGTVHDEIINEPEIADASDALARMLHYMRTPPPWATGLPLAAEGWVTDRYGKG